MTDKNKTAKTNKTTKTTKTIKNKKREVTKMENEKQNETKNVDIALQKGTWFKETAELMSESETDKKEVRWTSSNPQVAAVNEENGHIYGKGIGEAEITATAADGTTEQFAVSVTGTPVLVEEIKIRQPGRVVRKGSVLKLKASVYPGNAANKHLTWSSSNRNKIAVGDDNAAVVGDSGKVIISAHATDGSEVSNSLAVHIVDFEPAQRVDVDPTQITLVPGAFCDLVATICPYNTEYPCVYWTTSDPDIVTVNFSSGLIMAQSPGTAVVSAYAIDGSDVYGTCEVTVIPLDHPVTSVTINPTGDKLYVGDYAEYEAVVTPRNATYPKLTWFTDNTEVISVDENTGDVLALNEGTATLYAKALDGTQKLGMCRILVEAIHVDSVSVSPKRLDVVENEENVGFGATVCPRDATQKRLRWTSSNKSIALVNNLGRVFPKSKGEAIITATSIDGHKSDSATVKVYTGEKVHVKKDSHSFNIVFNDGKKWENIGCDLSLVENRSFLRNVDLPKNAEETRYFNNIEHLFSEQQIAYLYLYDPLGIEYYMKNDVFHRRDFTDVKKLNFIDDVFRNIFKSESDPDNRFFFVINGGKQEFISSNSAIARGRANCFSVAEGLFGYRNFIDWDWSTFVRSIVESLFGALVDKAFEKSIVGTGIKFYQALFHSGSILGACTERAVDYAKEYVNKAVKNEIIFKYGTKVHATVYWAYTLVSMLSDAAFDAITILNPSDVTIYNKILAEPNYLAFFDNKYEASTMEDIIQAVTK